MRTATAAIRRLARGPDRPLLALAALAWAILLAIDRTSSVAPICAAGGLGRLLAARADWPVVPGPLGGGLGLVASLIVMPAAMTAPLLSPLLSHVRRSNLYERRYRAVALALAGHFGVWAVAAAALMGLSLVVARLAAAPFFATALVVAAGLVWEGAPLKPLALNLSHRLRPLPACGWRADAASFGHGALSAACCAASCWALMLAPMTSGPAHLAAMAASAALMLNQRYATPIGAVARWRWIAAGLLLAVVDLAAAQRLQA